MIIKEIIAVPNDTFEEKMKMYARIFDPAQQKFTYKEKMNYIKNAEKGNDPKYHNPNRLPRTDYE